MSDAMLGFIAVINSIAMNAHHQHPEVFSKHMGFLTT